jgi:aminoglycoside phosphotransferase
MSTVQAIPHDRALPHLARALDEQAMSEVFSDALQGHGTAIAQCHLERVKYRPGRNCSLLYRLSMREGATGTLFEQRVAVRLCGNGESAQRAVQAGAVAMQSSLAGPALRLLPELDMLTWWWPNDPKLAAPRVLADARLMREQVLPPLVAVLSAARGTLVDYHLDIVQYIPEQRVCARVDVSWSVDGTTQCQRVYAKASSSPDTEAANAILRTLQASQAWRAGRIRTPRALLWQPHFKLHWLQELTGRSLLEVSTPDLVRSIGPLGTQLAALHQTPVPGLRPVTRYALATRLANAIEVLQHTHPLSSGMLERVSNDLFDGLAFVDGMPHATLHGDLHRGNVLVDGERVSLIDLDDLGCGPALLELGAWISDAMYFALLNATSPTADSILWQTLLESYEAAGGKRPPPEALAWAVAWNLVCQRASRCVLALKPGRFAIVPGLIELAAKIAAARSLEVA